METEQCNGWANRETWLVKLWIDNDKQSQLYWQKVARDLRASKGITDALPAIARCLERTIKDQAPKVAHGMYADLMSTALTLETDSPNLQHLGRPGLPDSLPAYLRKPGWLSGTAVKPTYFLCLQGLAEIYGLATGASMHK